MRWIFGPALLALTVFVSSVVAVAAQTSCAAWDRADPATAVFSARRNLMKEVVARDHPAVPLRVASELDELKRSLAAAADNVFLCAAPTATAERLQGYLAAVLQANLARAVASVDQTRDNEDRGAYGSDLAVQVEQISDTPSYFWLTSGMASNAATTISCWSSGRNATERGPSSTSAFAGAHPAIAPLRMRSATLSC